MMLMTSKLTKTTRSTSKLTFDDEVKIMSNPILISIDKIYNPTDPKGCDTILVGTQDGDIHAFKFETVMDASGHRLVLQHFKCFKFKTCRWGNY